MPTIPKFPDFEGLETPLNIKFFKKSFLKILFHEMIQPKGVRFKTFKSQSNMNHNSEPALPEIKKKGDQIFLL